MFSLRLSFLVALALLVELATTARPASAIPVFAHRYGFSCQVCHTEVPHLTPFGEQFLANGYRLPGVKPKPVFPIAVRTETTYSSSGPADADAVSGPLPKAVVSEIEFLTGGAIGNRVSYWAEVYAVDGGEPGRPRDVWAAYRATPDGSSVPVTLRAGEFTLPLPLDPETFRETTQPYAIWSQTAGNNPFNFFDVKIGQQTQIGDPARGLAGTVSFVQGHDTASTLHTNGIDTMETLERDYGPFSFAAYRYDGSRSFANVDDRFWRDGYYTGWHQGRTQIDALYQIGNDTVADIYGDALTTSGGFVQVRQDVGHKTFAVARWDATRDASFARTYTAGLGLRTSRNGRLTLFGTALRDETGRLQHVLSSEYLVAL